MPQRSALLLLLYSLCTLVLLCRPTRAMRPLIAGVFKVPSPTKSHAEAGTDPREKNKKEEAKPGPSGRIRRHNQDPNGPLAHLQVPLLERAASIGPVNGRADADKKTAHSRQRASPPPPPPRRRQREAGRAEKKEEPPPPTKVVYQRYMPPHHGPPGSLPWSVVIPAAMHGRRAAGADRRIRIAQRYVDDMAKLRSQSREWQAKFEREESAKDQDGQQREKRRALLEHLVAEDRDEHGEASRLHEQQLRDRESSYKRLDDAIVFRGLEGRPAIARTREPRSDATRKGSSS